jgi:hypothetical protein
MGIDVRALAPLLSLFDIPAVGFDLFLAKLPVALFLPAYATAPPARFAPTLY